MSVERGGGYRSCLGVQFHHSYGAASFGGKSFREGFQEGRRGTGESLVWVMQVFR